MLRWTSIAVSVVAATVAAKVLAQDTSQPTSQPERRAAAEPAARPVSQNNSAAEAKSVAQAPAIAPPTLAGGHGPSAHAEARQQPELVHRPQALDGERPLPRAMDERPRRHDRGYNGGDARHARRAHPARADWPLDQSRRFEGPRDAYGGRWIYVRPASRPRYRSRYAGQLRDGYGRVVPQRRHADAYRYSDQRLIDAPSYDRYPYNLGRRSDF